MPDPLHDGPGRLGREAQQARTRERLLAAGRREVARRGAAASVRDIAEAAGYTQGALYAQFGSKEGLLLELLRQHMREEAALLAGLLEAAEAEVAAGGREAGPGRAARVEGAVLARVDAWAAGLDRDTDWSTLALELQLHANRSAPAADGGRDFAAEYDTVYAAHRAALGTIIERLFVAVERTPPADPVALARGFMALAHGMAIGRGAAGEAGDRAVAAGPVLMVFLRALLASAPRATPADRGRTARPGARTAATPASRARAARRD